MPAASVVVAAQPPDLTRDFVASLVAQSVPDEQVELIIVAAGLTEEEAASVLGSAADEPRVRVLPAPPASQARPSAVGASDPAYGLALPNIGLDAVRGEYVLFLRSDRVLLPGALERLFALAAADQADVVLGRSVGADGGGAGDLWSGGNEPPTRAAELLMDNLSADALLRTEFLHRCKIRFRPVSAALSMRLFMAEVLCAASNISVDVDHFCSRSRSQADSLPVHGIGEGDYRAGLRQIFDVIDIHTEPGPRRDSLISGVLRGEILRRLGQRELASLPTAQAWRLLEETRSVCDERVPPRLDQTVGSALRPMAALVRTGTPEEVAELAARIDRVQPSVWMTALGFGVEPAVEIQVEVRMLYRGRPLRLSAGPDGWLLPSSVTGESVEESPPVVEDPAGMSAAVVLRHRQLKAELNLDSRLAATVVDAGDHAELVWSGSAQFGSRVPGELQQLPKGDYDFFVRVGAFGLSREKRLGSDRLDGLGQLPLIVDRAGRVHRLYYTARDNLSLSVGRKTSPWPKSLAPRAVLLHRDGIDINLGAVWTGRPPELSLSLTPTRGGVATTLPLTPGRRAGHWTADPARHPTTPRPGKYHVALDAASPPRSKEPRRHTIPLTRPVLVSGSLWRTWLARRVGRTVRAGVSAAVHRHS